MASISLEKANFLALVLETLLFGVFTVLFGASIWVILHRKHAMNNLLLNTLVVMWILSTSHWVIDICRAVNAYVPSTAGTALDFYLNLSNPLQVAKTAIYVTLTLVGDSFVIYRCYIVWGQTLWAIFFPILLLCGTGVSGYGATWGFSQALPGEPVFLSVLVPWVTGFIAMTFATNVFCTLLIAYRVVTIQRAIKSAATGNRAPSALAVVAESAALYSSSVLALLITYQVGSNAQYMVLDLTAPLIGITFSIIIIRVSMGLTSQKSAPTSRNRSLVSAASEGSNHFQLNRMNRPVAVNVSQLVEYAHDGFGGDSGNSFVKVA